MILAQTAGIAATQTDLLDLLDLATKWARKTEMYQLQVMSTSERWS